MGKISHFSRAFPCLNEHALIIDTVFRVLKLSDLLRLAAAS